MNAIRSSKAWIRRAMRTKVSPWLADNDLLAMEAASPRAIRALLASLRPVSTDRPLIRIGAGGDGGYLVPDDLDGVSTCFSPGVSEIAEFELALAGRGIRCFLADHSVDAPPVQHALIQFEKKFLGPKEDDVFMRMDNWISRAPADDSQMILQMDIEGAEYGVILDTADLSLQRFRIIVIEFHELHGLADRLGFELISLVFQKLLRHFDVVHIHPNNCRPALRFDGLEIPPVMEFTFLRKDRIARRSAATTFPHPLDRPNIADLADIVLPRCWHQS